MAEYVTIVEAARRYGVSDKTIRRAVHKGSLPARYPKPNQAEIAVSDLEAWRHPPVEQQAADHRQAELERRVLQLEQRVSELERQVAERVLAERLDKALITVRADEPIMLRPHAEVEAPAPDDLILLHAFADLHAISRNEANQRWRAGFIAGVKQGTGKRPMITIGAKGRRDFWVQFHNTSGFRACDQCPHSTV